MCYSNGVKILEEFDMSDPLATTTTVTITKGSTVCGSMISTYPNGVTSSTVKNGAGTTVATFVFDPTARTETITCTGGSPVVVSLDCFNSDGGTLSGSSSSCAEGTCVF